MVISHVFELQLTDFLTLSNRSRSKLLIVHTRGCFICFCVLVSECQHSVLLLNCIQVHVYHVYNIFFFQCQWHIITLTSDCYVLLQF